MMALDVLRTYHHCKFRLTGNGRVAAYAPTAEMQAWLDQYVKIRESEIREALQNERGRRRGRRDED